MDWNRFDKANKLIKEIEYCEYKLKELEDLPTDKLAIITSNETLFEKYLEKEKALKERKKILEKALENLKEKPNEKKN